MSVISSQGNWFLEKDECISCLAVICNSAVQRHGEKLTVSSPSSNPNEVILPDEAAFDRLAEIFGKYQEQSHLLDSHLESLVEELMNSVKQVIRLREAERDDGDSTDSFPFQVYRNPGLDLVLKTMYTLCKVRGYKSIVKHMPHEVADLEPALRLLQSQDTKDYTTWESRYSLLLWLSMLALIPFDLETVDSGNRSVSLVETIVELCKSYLNDSGVTRHSAAICLAKLLTRPDMENIYLESFLSWSCTTLEEIASRKEKNESIQSDIFLVTGVFQALVETFKFGHREKLLSHIPVIFERALQISSRGGNVTSLERKLTIKLVQRAGLNFLPPKIVAWRYQRGHRSLLRNLQVGSGVKQQVEQEVEEEEDDIDIPAEIEEVIEKLLCGLRDRDTIVRWSAAKGIGRVTGRLPQAFANDVVSFVLELFDVSEGDCAWHGGCLALAELARRGLLLPDVLGTVVPFVTQALVYDVRRGHNSVGANVRDAACYVCWAFARAYEPHVMTPHVSELAQQMLVTALFDREVNCRRAASAAFQENVGRQGHENFPHGIEILTKADYFTLAIRANAFMKISCHVAKFDIYRPCLIKHLVERKLCHWDLSLRMLSAQTLHILTMFDPKLMVDQVLTELLPKALSPDMLQRHGATLGIGQIVVALAKARYQMSNEMLSDVRNTIMRIEKARLYRGRGGEWMRVAACELIQSIASSGHALTSRAQIRLLESIEESMKHAKDEVKNAAVEALRLLTLNYFGPDDDKIDDGADALAEFITSPYTVELSEDMMNRAVKKLGHPYLPQSMRPASKTVISRLVDKYCKTLEDFDPNPAVRRGTALALGVLPAKIVAADGATLDRVISALVIATKQEDEAEQRDAEVRRNALLSLGKLVENVGIGIPDSQVQKTRCLNAGQLSTVFDALVAGCDDYEIDNRGDVGSWVRSASIKSLVTVVRFVRTYPGKVLAFEAGRSDNDVLECVNTKSFGKAKVVRWIANGGAAWIKTDVLRKVPASEIIRESGRFVMPAASERSGALVSDSITKASDALTKAESIPELGSYRESVAGLYLPPALCERIVNVFLKQLCEKMPMVRECAGKALGELLCDADDPSIGLPFVVSNVDELRDIFGIRAGVARVVVIEEEEDAPNDESSDEEEGDEDNKLNWQVESEAYSRVAQVLSMNEYIDSALSGLVLSVGALTESVSKNSAHALMNWCKTQKANKQYSQLNRMAASLWTILKDNIKCDRVIVPAMKALDMIFESQVLIFRGSPKLEWLLGVHDAVKEETRKCTNVSKLHAAGNIFFHLANFGGPVRTVALSSVMILLGHPYPSVRMSCAKDFSVWGLAMDGDRACGLVDETPETPDNNSSGQFGEMIAFVKEKNAEHELKLLQSRDDVKRLDKDPEFDSDDAFDRVLDIVAETRWDAISTKEARTQRDLLFELLLLHKSIASSKPDGDDKLNRKPVPQVEEDSYATLIKNTEQGY